MKLSFGLNFNQREKPEPTWLKIVDVFLIVLSLTLLLLLFSDFLFHNSYLKTYDLLFNILWFTFAFEFVSKLILAKDKLLCLRQNFLFPIIIFFPFLRPLKLLPFFEFESSVLADQIDKRFPILERYHIFELLILTVVGVIIIGKIFFSALT